MSTLCHPRPTHRPFASLHRYTKPICFVCTRLLRVKHSFYWRVWTESLPLDSKATSLQMQRNSFLPSLLPEGLWIERNPGGRERQTKGYNKYRSVWCQVQKATYPWCLLGNQSACRPPGWLKCLWLFSALPIPPSTLSSPAHGLPSLSFSSLYNLDVSAMCSLGPLTFALSLSSSLLFLSRPSPSPLMANFGLLAMSGVLLSLPALDSSRCLWLYSPSHLQ